VRAIASTAVERGILSQVRGYFLSVVRDRGDLPPDVMASLIRAAAGILRLEDINNFGRWYDVQSEKVLLAVLADSTDPVLLAEAFDNLSGKSLTIEPAVSLVDWVRGRHWDNRANFAHAIGVLSFIDLVSVDDVIRALQGLDAFARDPKLIAILLDTRNTAVVRTVVEKYSEMLGLGGLISLLSYPEKEIRIIAVRKLKDFNDVAALRLIIQNYNNEKEQDVRQIYRETFWVIRERE
jgi:hypothetical protein